MKKIKLSYTLEESEDISIEDFGDEADDALEQLIFEYVKTEVWSCYAEWPRPYGDNPYAVIEINMDQNQKAEMYEKIILCIVEDYFDLDVSRSTISRIH